MKEFSYYSIDLPSDDNGDHNRLFFQALTLERKYVLVPTFDQDLKCMHGFRGSFERDLVLYASGGTPDWGSDRPATHTHKSA